MLCGIRRAGDGIAWNSHLPSRCRPDALVRRTCAEADAWATLLERVEFESASQRLVSGALIPGDRIQGDLARPDGAGPFPAVIGLHGCAGMHDATKQRLVDELVARGYVVLLVESFATRGIDHACTSSAYAPSSGAGRMPMGRSSSWLAKPSSIHGVWLRSASRLAPGLPSRWRSPMRSNSSSLPATCGSGRRLRSILHAAGSGTSGDTHAHLHWSRRRLDAGGRLLR